MTYYVMSVDAIALTGGTAKSVLELKTASTTRIWIKEWWATFDGVTATNTPVKCEVGRFSSAVTTATSFTAGKFDAADGTPDTTATHSASTEGAGTIDAGAGSWRIPPTSGYHYIAPLGGELVVPVSGFWRMRLTSATSQNVNATVGVVWFE